jgi:Xaa-Pro dipeptidase
MTTTTTTSPGSTGPDLDGPLRAARRERLFAAMDAAGLDVLVLGRRDDVAYATGARALWTAGTRPFGPACVVVGASRATHLLSTWDAGVPPEIPFDRLFGVTWNPAVMAEALRAVPGLPEARRVGVDAWSPGFARALPRLAPGAALVPADDVVRAARAVKLPAEVERIATAVAVARSSLDAAADVVAAGGGAAAARAAAITALAERGGLIPTSGVAVEPVAAGDPRWRVDVGVLVDAYEGGVGRTVGADGSLAGDDGAAAEAQRAVLVACRAGATGADVARASSDSGADHWLVRGSGMGYELPVVTDGAGAAATLAAGMVLSVEVQAAGDLRRDLALVTDDAAARLL